MAIRDTIQVGHPALKAENKAVKDFDDPVVRRLIEDLTDTMHETGLIGIAAPQIGENYRVFITEPRQTQARPKDQADELRVFINPSIVETSADEIVLFEGCGSVVSGQLFGPVTRPKMVTVEAYDRNGKRFRFTADGILGRVMQHEMDHLDGIEFMENVSDYKQLKTLEHYMSQVKSDPVHKTASSITTKKITYL